LLSVHKNDAPVDSLYLANKPADLKYPISMLKILWKRDNYSTEKVTFKKQSASKKRGFKKYAKNAEPHDLILEYSREKILLGLVEKIFQRSADTNSGKEILLRR